MNHTRTFVAALLLSACGADASGTAPPASPTPASEAGTTESVATASMVTSTDRPADLADMTVVAADGRIVVLRNGATSEPITGLVATDQRTLIRTEPQSVAGKTATSVSWLTLDDGIEQGRVELTGELTAIATDPTGNAVALTHRDKGGIGTEIVIATPDGEAFRRRYTSELLPEGFSNIFLESTDVPAGLFVIEYLDPPPGEIDAPRRYQVRVLDTATGELALPLNLREKAQTVDEQMLGFGRSHVLSPRNGLLFTLYRGLDSDEVGYAFVHTLGFVNGVWCLDLPIELDLAALPGALALSADETTLLVASANGYVAEFSIADLTDLAHEPSARRTVRVWQGAAGASAPALAAGAARFVVGQGDELRWFHADTLTMTTLHRVDMAIEAVALMANGDSIVAGSGRVSQVTEDGELVAVMPLPEGFGPVMRIVLDSA